MLFSLMTVTAQRNAPIGAQAAAVARANNSFAFDAYARLPKGQGNFFFSPYSAESALAMAWAGAAGRTASQMASALHLPDEGHVNAGFEALMTKFKSDEQEAGDEVRGQAMNGIPYQLFVANSMWCQQGFPFHDAFLKIGQHQYGASLQRVDFQRAPDAAAWRINDWVAKQTHGKIENIISGRVIDPTTRLVLADAIYFRARWRVQFEKSRTHDAPFHLDFKHAFFVPTMNVETELGYYEAEQLRVLEIPYFSRRISMIILLPTTADGLSNLDSSLNDVQMNQWLAQMQPRQVNLFLPRFKFATEIRLDDTLRAMGMTDAFSSKADFSRIADAPLFISAVLQKAFVDVNEEGTEATAATIVASAAGALPQPPPPVLMKVDHPFIFLLRHNETGAILFIGRVSKP